MTHVDTLGSDTAANMARALWLHLGTTSVRDRMVRENAYLREQLLDEASKYGVLKRDIADKASMPMHELDFALEDSDGQVPGLIEEIIDAARKVLSEKYQLF